VIAIATALAIYSGWIETLYIFSLLVGAWVVLRFVQLASDQRWWFARKAGAGAACGALLAAPLLIPFLGYLGAADVGGHAAGTFSTYTLPKQALSTVAGLPYALGPVLGYHDPQGKIYAVWANVGGFLSIAIVFLALLGCFGRRQRPLRLLLVAWVVLCLVKSFGPHFLVDLFNLLPGADRVAFYRYMPASLELAAIVLAAFAVDDLIRGTIDRRGIAIVTACVIALLGLVALVVRGTVDAAGANRYLVVSLLWAVGVVAVLVVAAWLGKGRPLLAILVVGLVIVDVGAAYAVPTFSAPRRIEVDTTSVTWLKNHLHTTRYFTFYPVAANYGSYWDIGSVASTNVPIPKRWFDKLQAALGAGIEPGDFSFTVAGLTAVSAHPRLLQQLSATYVLLAHGGQMGAPLAPDLVLVHRDRAADIYRLRGAKPYFETRSGNCRINVRNRRSAELNCRSRARLVRRELSFPGWTATVDGRSVPIRTVDRLFQTIDVPEGTSHVEFSYVPPHWTLAVLMFLVGLLWLVSPTIMRMVVARSSRDQSVARIGEAPF
jgi:hypothetical protein